MSVVKRHICGLYFILFVLSSSVYASSSLDVYDVKSAYVYSFLKFTKWSETSEDDTLNVCVFGDDEMYSTLKPLETKSRLPRTIRIVNKTSEQDALGCNVIYLSSAIKSLIKRKLESVGENKVLTISDDKGFASLGGMVELVPIGNVIKFKLNMRELTRRDLAVSSKLIDIAIEVVWK